MTLHRLHLDHKLYNRKPQGKEIGAISSRIIESPVEINVRDLSSQLVAPISKTWIPAILEEKRTAANWKSQSIFALDFDDGIAFSKALERLHEYDLDCTFAYTTFSDSPELAKFRIVFQLECAITDPAYRDTIQLSLMMLFPEVDKSCKDRSRLFFGGKELIYENYEYYLDIDKLIEAARFYGVKDSSSKNFKRDLKRKSKKIGVNRKSGSEKHSPYIYTIEGVESASKLTKTKTTPALVRGVDFSKLRQEIRILDDFLNPTHKLRHPQLLGLATNLLYLEGGQQLYKECINANSEYATDEKLKVMAYCRTNSYHPMRLERFSSYEEDWEYTTLLRAAKRKEVIRLEAYESISVEDARKKLKDIFVNEVIPSGNTDIHVIKVPTATGKTQLCTDLENVVIGLPNHALKSEVSDRMQVNHLSTPDLEKLSPQIKSHLAYYYSIGANEEAIRYLQALPETDESVRTYLSDCIECYDTSTTVLTTHQRALFIDWNHNTIIFDEDILGVLLPISKITINDLVRLETALENDNDKAILQGLISDITLGKISSPRSLETSIFQDFNAIEESVLTSQFRYDGDILHFFDASYFVVDSRDKATIHYVRQYEDKLPVDKKIIILSATSNETLYRHLFGDRLKFYDIGNVELTGFIEQDTSYSFSRSSLSRKIGQAIEKVGELPTITFSTFKHQFPNAVEHVHFGKTSGFDKLRGEDIAVLGTPHMNPTVLSLYTSALGMQVRTSDFSKIGQQCVIHNGFRFWFNAYDNEHLRLLQFYFIESDLRQAVGRARVNIEPAHVKVFSSYPLPEAAINDEEIAEGKQRLEDARKAHLKSCLEISHDTTHSQATECITA
ncbi:MAG: hypothetical protein AAGN15_24615 [Cyanobacteria bacterium J06581_3]